MKRARTDAEISLAAEEFIWESGGLTEADASVLPVISAWLEEECARKILDLGCGNGAFTNAIAQPGRELLGMDVSQSGIEIARRSGSSSKFLQGTIDLPLPADLHGYFDTVISVEVIEHLMLPRQLIRRAREALMPGGHLILSTPYHGYWKNLAVAVAGKFDEHWHPLRDHGHIKFFSLRTISQLLREEGFRVKAIVRVGRVPCLARSMIIHGQLW